MSNQPTTLIDQTLTLLSKGYALDTDFMTYELGSDRPKDLIYKLRQEGFNIQTLRTPVQGTLYVMPS